jgi:hypothetical protein
MNFRFFDERRIADYADGDEPWLFESAASPWANTGEIPLIVYTLTPIIIAYHKSSSLRAWKSNSSWVSGLGGIGNGS